MFFPRFFHSFPSCPEHFPELSDLQGIPRFRAGNLLTMLSSENIDENRGPLWHRKGLWRPLESNSRPEKPWMQLVFRFFRHVSKCMTPPAIFTGEMGESWDSFPGAPCGGHKCHRTEWGKVTESWISPAIKGNLIGYQWDSMGRFTGIQNFTLKNYVFNIC